MPLCTTHGGISVDSCRLSNPSGAAVVTILFLVLFSQPSPPVLMELMESLITMTLSHWQADFVTMWKVEVYRLWTMDWSSIERNTSSPCAAIFKKEMHRPMLIRFSFETKFSNIHRIFWASNVTMMLHNLPKSSRVDAWNLPLSRFTPSRNSKELDTCITRNEQWGSKHQFYGGEF